MNANSLFQIGLRAPSQVTGLSLSKAVRAGSPALKVNWTASQSEVPISWYTVEYRKSGAAFRGNALNISGSPPLTSTFLIQLTVGTEYNVRVRAVSTVGNGMWSVVQTERTYNSEFLCFPNVYIHTSIPSFTGCFPLECMLIAVPPHPNHHTVRTLPVDRRGVIRVSWSAPNVLSEELPITGYSIRYKVQNSSSFNYKNVTATSVDVMISGLFPGTSYQVYVAGIIAIGRGPYCCERTPLVVTTHNGKFS